MRCFPWFHTPREISTKFFHQKNNSPDSSFRFQKNPPEVTHERIPLRTRLYCFGCIIAWRSMAAPRNSINSTSDCYGDRRFRSRLFIDTGRLTRYFSIARSQRARAYVCVKIGNSCGSFSNFGPACFSSNDNARIIEKAGALHLVNDICAKTTTSSWVHARARRCCTTTFAQYGVSRVLMTLDAAWGWH